MKTTKKQQAVILANIEANKDIQKNIKKLNYFDSEHFFNMAQTYLKAIRESRMVCSIGSVSSSGMSRTMKFTSCEFNAKEKSAYYYNYYCLFITLGYSEARAKNCYFSISGCGMDMVFNTNYNIIHDLKRLNFITDEECRKLSQMTPTVL